VGGWDDRRLRGKGENRQGRSNKKYLRLFHSFVHHCNLLGQLLFMLFLQSLDQEQAVPAGLLSGDGDGLVGGHFTLPALQGRVEKEARQNTVMMKLLSGGHGGVTFPGLHRWGRGGLESLHAWAAVLQE